MPEQGNPRPFSIWLKIALGSITLGIVLFIIGFARVWWLVSSENFIMRYKELHADWGSIGLWQIMECKIGALPVCNTHDVFHLHDFHLATQILECMALMGQVVSLILLILYILSASLWKRQEVLRATIAILFLSAVCMSIGMVVFAIRYQEMQPTYKIGSSMMLTIAGCVLTVFTSVMCILQDRYPR